MDVMTAEIGRSPGQDDQRASILLRKGDVQDALAIWRELLPRWKPTDEFDLQQPYSCRLAAVAAARLDEWAESADWLRRARELAHEDPATFSAGLLIDEGYARWKGGDNSAALEALVEGLIAIDRLPSDGADENAYLLRKHAGHTMMWMANAAAGRSSRDFSEPPPAWCSMPEPFKDKLPVTPSDAMWTHVVEFEFVAGLGDQHFRAHETQLKASRYGPIRLGFNILRLQQRLRNLTLDDLVEVVADYAESFALTRLYYKEKGLKGADPLPEDAEEIDRNQLDVELVLSGLLNAVFALAARDGVTREVLQRLEVSAARVGLSAMVTPWLEFVEGLFVSNTLNARIAMQDRLLAWPWQVSASIRIAIDSTTRPVELLVIHDLWANVLPKTGAGLFVLADIEHLVTGAWRRLAESRFLLRAPAVTAPALLQACNSASTGWRKIGEVLTAACDAVPDTISEDFKKRAQDLWKHDRD